MSSSHKPEEFSDSSSEGEEEKEGYVLDETKAEAAETEDRAALLVNSYLPTTPPPTYSSSSTARLPSPLCVPPTSNGLEKSYIRAWNPALTEVGITQDEWVQFTDGLNMALIGSPAIGMVGTAGQIIGMVPDPLFICMGVGIGLQIGAGVASGVVAKTLTDKYLKAANAKLFHPHNVSVRICSGPATMALLGMSPEKELTKLDKAGRVAGQIGMRLPIPFAKTIIKAIADSPHAGSGGARMRINNPQRINISTLVLKNLDHISGHSLALDLDVPPPKQAKDIWDKMQAYGVSRKERKRVRKQSRKDYRIARREMRISYMRDGLRKERRQRKLDRRIASKELTESWNMDSTRWLVLMNKEQDALIQGVTEYDADKEPSLSPGEKLEYQQAEANALADSKAGSSAYASGSGSGSASAAPPYVEGAYGHEYHDSKAGYPDEKKGGGFV